MKTESSQLVQPELSEVREHFRRAVERLSADIAADPGDNDALIKRAVAYRVLGEFEQAMQDYDRLAVSCPLDPPVLHSKGITLLSQGEVATAAKAFDQANESDPWDVESYYRRVATRPALGGTAGPSRSLTSSLAHILVRHSTPASGSRSKGRDSCEAHEYRRAGPVPIVVPL